MRAPGGTSGERHGAELLKFRWELQTKLADGPVTDTWQAWDRIKSETVVVKILRERWSTDEKVARRWLQELGRQRGHAFPAATAMLETGRDGERFFFVREWIEGPSLERWMNQKRSIDQALGCAVALLRAAGQWHEAGICHGQLHPGNIVLSASGPVFCDWDVTAQTFNCLGVLPTRRKHRVYLAPEVRTRNTAAAGSDVYSIGVVLWELVTGRRLVEDLDEIPAPSSIRADLPPALDVVVEGMLKAEPDDRYPAAQAAEALAKLRGRAEPVTDNSPRERRRQRARDRRALPRKPLPWPVTVVLVFYRLLFIVLFTGLVSAATLVGMGAASYRYLVDSIPAEVIIPDVIGKDLEPTQKMFEHDLGLRFTIGGKQPSATVPAGKIVGTRPEPGRRVREGRTIEAIVSSGAELVTVPRLVEQPLGEAERQLAKLGLKLGETAKKPDPRVEAGKILSQNPGPGRKVAAGTAITVFLSSGPPSEQPEAKEKPATSAEGTKAGPTGATAQAKKVGHVRITVPSAPRQTQVKILVRDGSGERVVYDETRDAGDVVDKTVEGRGETVVEVYLNGTKVETKVL